MKEREPGRGHFTDKGRDAGGPAPPERKKKTGYYQRFAKDDAATPEALSSPSGYEPRPGQEATERPCFTDGPEEPGRLRFTPSDELKQGAGDPPHDNRQHGRGTARHFADDGRPPENAKPARLHFTKEERPTEQAAPEPSGSTDGKSVKTDAARPKQQRKTERAGAKAGRADAKLEKARDKLPTRHRPRLRQEADPTTGRLLHRLRFEQETKPAPTHSGPISGLAAGAAGAAAYFGNEDGRKKVSSTPQLP